MANHEHEVRVTPSLLDRLIDMQPGIERDLAPSRYESIRRYRESVQRDLENLLNTRNSFAELPADFSEVGKSTIAYGLPDFSNLNIANPNDRNRLAHLLELVIRNFEPRLEAVNIAVGAAEKTDRAVKFRIDARLILEPAPEPVSFDMVLQLDSQECRIEESD